MDQKIIDDRLDKIHLHLAIKHAVMNSMENKFTWGVRLLMLGVETQSALIRRPEILAPCLKTIVNCSASFVVVVFDLIEWFKSRSEA